MNERINSLAPLLTADEVNQFNRILFRRARNVIEAIEQHPSHFPHPRWNLGCLQNSEVQGVEQELILDSLTEGVQHFISPGIITSATEEQELGRKELRYRKMTKRWEEFISTATRAVALSCKLTPDPNYKYNELPVRTVACIPFLGSSAVTIKPSVGLFDVNLQFKGKRDYERNMPYLKNLASILGVRAFGHCDQKIGFAWIGNNKLGIPNAEISLGCQSFNIDSDEAVYAFLLAIKDIQVSRN